MSLPKWTISLNRNGVLIGLLFLGLIGAGTMIYATRWGPSAYGDSVGYIEVAHNLMVGKGPVQIKGSGGIMLLTTRPPFYSMVLALFSLAGQPLIDSARYLDVILFALFVAGLGLAVDGLLHQPLLSIAISLFLLVSPTMVSNFASAMSEPLFYVLGFAGLLLLVYYLQTGRQYLLWISAGLTGLGFITRFTGVTFIGTGCLILLFFPGKTLSQRIKESLSYGLAGLVPFLLWLIYLRVMGTYPGQYLLPSYPQIIVMLRSCARAFIDIFFGWLPWGGLFAAQYPYHHGLIFFIIALAVLVGLAVTFSRLDSKSLSQSTQKPSLQLGVTFGVFILVYSLFLILTYLIVLNPKPRLDERMLSPLLIASLLGGSGFLSFVLDSIKGPDARRFVIPAILLVFIVAYTPLTYQYVQKMYAVGDGYTSRAWHESGVIPALKTLPSNVRIISDDINAIMFFTFRPASRIPELESHTPEPINQTFGDDQKDVVQRLFHDKQAVLVLFNQGYWQFDALYGGETQKRLNAFTRGLYPYFKGSDGAIYYYAAP